MLAVLSSATAEPVTVEECKQQLRVESTREDELIKSYIEIARRTLENKIRRTIMRTQYILTLKDFPADSTSPIELPMPPLHSSTCSTVSTSTSVCMAFYADTTVIKDIKYVDATAIAVDTGELLPKIYPINSNEWPSSVSDDQKDAVQITYWAGYPSRKEVPEPLKHWIKMKVGLLYEVREAFSMRDYNPNRLEHEFFDTLLDQYKIIKVI